MLLDWPVLRFDGLEDGPPVTVRNLTAPNRVAGYELVVPPKNHGLRVWIVARLVVPRDASEAIRGETDVQRKRPLPDRQDIFLGVSSERPTVL